MIIGIDYASIDGNAAPDLTAAKQAGIRFAIIRGSYGTWKDPTIQRDWENVRLSGLVRGAYMFPIYSGDPTEEAKRFAENVGNLGPGDMPPILDIEFPGHGISDTGMTPKQAVDWLTQAGLYLINRYGTVMVYTSGRVWHEDLKDAKSVFFRGCPLWLARYTYGTRQPVQLQNANLIPGVVPSQLGDPDDYWMLQYQGDGVNLPGFNKTVDMNIFRLLYKGMKGERVGWLRARLGLSVIDNKGDQSANVFDQETHDALVAFQRRNLLTVDGICGPQTFASVCWNRIN